MRPWSKPPEMSEPIRGHRAHGNDKVQFAVRLDVPDFELAARIAHSRGLRLGELLRGMIVAQLDVECEVADDARVIAAQLSQHMEKERAA